MVSLPVVIVAVLISCLALLYSIPAIERMELEAPFEESEWGAGRVVEASAAQLQEHFHDQQIKELMVEFESEKELVH